MHKKIFTAVLCLYPVLMVAQNTPFDLSGYKLPDIIRHSLEGTLDFQGGNNYRLGRGTENMQNYLSGNNSLRYLKYGNNADEQNGADYSLGLYTYYYKSGTPGDQNYISGQFRPSLRLNRSRRIYDGDILFSEVGYLLEYSYGRNRSENSYTGSSSTGELSHSNKTQLVIPLKVGYGRIEQVQDARHALYIIHELQAAGQLPRALNEEEITRLAELISQLKNERFFDARNQLVHELEVVDSFLMANGCVKEHNARYFSVLQDVWRYGGGPVRSSGRRIAWAVYPGIFYGDQKEYQSEDGNILSRYHFNLMSRAIFAGPEFVYEKPLNLAWQYSLSLYTDGGIAVARLRNFIPDEKVDFRFPLLEGGLQTRIGFFPNTRTSMSLDLGASAIKIWDATRLEKEIIGLDLTAINLNAGMQMDYYISPQLRLNLSSSLNHFWQDNPTLYPLQPGTRAATGGSLLGGLLSTMDEGGYSYDIRYIYHTFRLTFLYSIY